MKIAEWYPATGLPSLASLPSLAASLMLIGLAAVGPIGCGRKSGEASLPPARGEKAAPLPTLPEVAIHDDGKTVSATNERTTGSTVARAEAQVGPNTGGVIAKVFVKEGDKVRRGTVLFRQVTRDAELRVEQGKAALESARVNLKSTEIELARTRGLFEQKAVNQMEWDQIQARAEAARAAVQQSEVTVAIAEKMLADCTVRSPIDGVVAAKLKSDGEMATMTPPTVVLVIQDQSTLELRFRLPEGALAQVKAGQTVEANFGSMGIKRPAKIVRIQPTADPHTRTIEVVAEIPNRDGALKSGLLAEVELAKTATATAPAAPTATAPAAPIATPGAPSSAGAAAPSPLPGATASGSQSRPSPSGPSVVPLPPRPTPAPTATADAVPPVKKREGKPQ